MAKKTINTVRLGGFVLAGLAFLIVLLYMVGRNKNLFGPAFVLKARFENVHGLAPGNNVRLSGIEIGTVKKIDIISDTVIEVVMVIQDRMKNIIRTNAIASIGSDGLMGNKVVNILPVRQAASYIAEGESLTGNKAINTDNMLQLAAKTNQDLAIIAAQLKTTTQRINTSTALWAVLNDDRLPERLRISAANVQLATARAATMAGDLQTIVGNVKNGNGSLGALLTDTAFSNALQEAVDKIRGVGNRADSLAGSLNAVIAEVRHDLSEGRGTVNALLKDSTMVAKISSSLDNIQKGTDGFSQNMEALKHNFLFRGYFRKQEKQKKKNGS